MSRALCGAGMAAAAFPLLASSAAAKEPSPRSLAAAERRTLDRVFEHAHPVYTYLIPYAKKIAVVWVFDHVVICGACSAPGNTSLSRGRVIRISFDRRTHAILTADGLRFCESRRSQPSLAECLRR